MSELGLQQVPMLGRVACGISKYAEEKIEEHIRLPADFLGKGSFCLLHADGDSMVDADIDDGGLVLIRKQHTEDPG